MKTNREGSLSLHHPYQMKKLWCHCSWNWINRLRTDREPQLKQKTPWWWLAMNIYRKDNVKATDLSWLSHDYHMIITWLSHDIMSYEQFLKFSFVKKQMTNWLRSPRFEQDSNNPRIMISFDFLPLSRWKLKMPFWSSTTTLCLWKVRISSTPVGAHRIAHWLIESDMW
jgi:hypothetical protein